MIGVMVKMMVMMVMMMEIEIGGKMDDNHLITVRETILCFGVNLGFGSRYEKWKKFKFEEKGIFFKVKMNSNRMIIVHETIIGLLLFTK